MLLASGCVWQSKPEPDDAGTRAAASFQRFSPAQWESYLQMRVRTTVRSGQLDLIAGDPSEAAAANRRAGFTYTPGFDQPMPRFETSPGTDEGLIVLPADSSRDTARYVTINGVPMGMLLRGMNWSMPVPRNSAHTVELFRKRLGARGTQPDDLELIARFVVRVR